MHQVILPEPPQWEIEHHTYMHELRDRRKKHFPPEFIDEKRTIGASATVSCLVCARLRAQGCWSLRPLHRQAAAGQAASPPEDGATVSCVLMVDPGTQQTTMSCVSKAAETAALWQPAPRRTAADEADDRRSTDRRLDERLILLLKSPGGIHGPSLRTC
jgi:hypothetical protein